MTLEQSKEEILKELDQKATEYLKISGNCAQSSFLALKEQFGLDDGSVLKALTPFPGLVYRGGICGTVVGCIMALGLIFGRDKLEDWDGYIHAIPPVRAFYRHFEKAEGSIMCLDVVESVFGEKFEAIGPAETKKLLLAGAMEKCADTIKTGVRIAAEIILERKR